MRGTHTAILLLRTSAGSEVQATAHCDVSRPNSARYERCVHKQSTNLQRDLPAMWSNQRVRWLQRRGGVHLPGMRRRGKRRAAGSVITTMADVADVPPHPTTSLDHGRTFQKHDECCAQQKPGTRALLSSRVDFVPSIHST